MCVFVCVFMMVPYGDTVEATALVCVIVCVFVMVQYVDNLEFTAQVCMYFCVYLGWFNLVTIRPQHWCVCVCVYFYVC